MARTGRVNHTHQYFRHANGLWYCSGIEGCSHYIPKNMPEPTGRKSICWHCEKEFQLTPVNMKEDKPKCDACSEESDILNRFIEDKLSKIPKKTGLEAFGGRPRIKPPVKVEKDEIEVIEPHSDHSPECEIFIGGECNCK